MHLQKRIKKTLGSLNLNNAKSFKDNGYLIIPKILSGELLDFIGIYAYNKARLEGQPYIRKFFDHDPEISQYFSGAGLSDGVNYDTPRQAVRKFTGGQIAFEGIGKTDHQVPNTPNFYCDLQMENLSDFLLPKIESAAGMKLLSTYTFFRVYKAGDILEKHIDRPACEISISLCLRKKGNIWPIYVNNTDYKMVESTVDRPTNLENMHQEHIGDTTSILLEEGDAVVYKGCELVHWRESYIEGMKQAQAFLHYVDANGPHSEWKNDKQSNKYFAQDK